MKPAASRQLRQLLRDVDRIFRNLQADLVAIISQPPRVTTSTRKRRKPPA